MTHHPIRAGFVTSLAAGLMILGSTGLVRAESPATKPVTPGTQPAAPATKPSASATTKPSAVAVKPATKPAGPPLTLAAPPRAIPTLPSSAADLRAIEQRVSAVTSQVMPAVVGVSVGSGQGSGVIISPDGYVLTAAHVSGEPNVDISLTLPDGRRIKAKTLGVNKKIDSGLIKIVDEGPWPYCEIGQSADLKKGQWVVALGHPGGYRKDRPPVLRLGRVLRNDGVDSFLMTDCTLVGGDSGGPLFDLDGRVVGIHSRIGPSTLNNMHTPADTYTQTWDRLVDGQSWGETLAFLRPNGPMLGVGGENVDNLGGARVTSLTPKGPAADAGLKMGDIITTFDGKKVVSIDELALMISKKKSGDQVKIEVIRDGKKVDLSATLARRPRD